MDIAVKQFRTYSIPITVTYREDGIITDCNHAGAGVEELIAERFDSDSGLWTPDDCEHRTVCDKCDAQMVQTDDGGEWIL